MAIFMVQKTRWKNQQQIIWGNKSQEKKHTTIIDDKYLEVVFVVRTGPNLT